MFRIGMVDLHSSHSDQILRTDATVVCLEGRKALVGRYRNSRYSKSHRLATARRGDDQELNIDVPEYRQSDNTGRWKY